jgi:hypothetical protein
VLVLGPDAAIDPCTSARPSSLSEQAANHIAEHLSGQDAVVHRDNFAHVAQVYVTEHRSHVDLENLVKEFYDARCQCASQFHLDLASLPFSLILQTSHDELFLRALEAQGKQPRRYWYDRNKAGEIPDEPSPERPLLYELFGSIQDKESLTLTEADLLDFLAKVLSSTPALPSKLLSRVRDKRTSFLFLGFGFSDWSARIMLHALRQELADKEKSLAFEVESALQDPHHARAAMFFDKVHAVEFPQADLTTFARQLAERMQTVPAPVESQATLPAGAPRVFLCYTGEDSSQVQDLERRLVDRGIAIWRDKQSLRGGDNWRQLIPEVIDNHVNYFIVCATKALQQRDESYCFWEIKQALQRQERQAKGLRFMIQGLFAADSALNDVPSDLHRVSLYEPQGFPQLVDTIFDDWKKRHP